MSFLKQIDTFLQHSSSRPKIVVIYGPTASGKTSLSLEVAKYIEGEIISTDARQIYKYLNIGTGKILHSEMGNIPHYMIDIIDPDEKYNVGLFQKQAFLHIGEIYKRGKIPILVGGTGLYIDSIIYDFSLSDIPNDPELKKILEQTPASKLYKQLQDLDPEYAKDIHPNNLPYIIRALEVKLLTGKSKTEFRTPKTLLYDTLFLTPYKGEREILYETINNRVDEMFQNGFVEEVQDVLKKGYSLKDPGLQTMGYKEIGEYLEGIISLNESIQSTKQKNRNYAKRQLTWFRKYEKNV